MHKGTEFVALLFVPFGFKLARKGRMYCEKRPQNIPRGSCPVKKKKRGRGGRGGKRFSSDDNIDEKHHLLVTRVDIERRMDFVNERVGHCPRAMQQQVLDPVRKVCLQACNFCRDGRCGRSRQ